MSALCLLEHGESRRDSVKDTFDVDVDSTLPFVYFERRERRNRHNASVIHQDIDLAVSIKRLLNQGVNLIPLRHIHCDRECFAAFRGDVLYDGIETIFAASPQHYRCAEIREMTSGAFAKPAARAGDDNSFPSMFLVMIISLLWRSIQLRGRCLLTRIALLLSSHELLYEPRNLIRFRVQRKVPHVQNVHLCFWYVAI
jgi:hypothetical protein